MNRKPMTSNQNKSQYTFTSITQSKLDSILSSRTAEEKLSNISEENLEIFSDFAVANKIGIILRPVNPIAFCLLSEGGVGKNMFIHGKSSEYGPIKGLIPREASISKAAKGSNPNKIAKFNAENNHSIENSAQRLEELNEKLQVAAAKLADEGKPRTEDAIMHEAKIAKEEFNEIIILSSIVDKQENQIYSFKDKLGRALIDKDREPVFAIKKDDKFYAIDNEHQIKNNKALRIEKLGYEPVAIEVFSKPTIKISEAGEITITKTQPITADIDVLAYATKEYMGQGKIESYQSILRQNKQAIIDQSNIDLDQEQKEQVLSKTINQLIKEKIIDSGTPEEKEFIDEIRNTEILCQHLKGMGTGRSTVLNITGALREDFQENVEVSHGPEQFNLHFPQDLDKEWVHIDEKGELSSIKGEQQLVKVFNEYLDKGYSIPPSPHWGWRMEDGKYSIDPKLKNIYQQIDSLADKVGKNPSNEQKEAIRAMKQERIELGTKLTYQAFHPLEDTEKLLGEARKMETSLTRRVDEYKQKYLPEDLKIVSAQKITPSEKASNLNKNSKKVLALQAG